MTSLHLTSLGSSFASGPGISPVVSYVAYRSGNNYPSILCNLLNTDRHTDVTMAGSTIENILSKPLRWQAPQVESVQQDDDIVTITAAGNDIGYIGDLLRDSFSDQYFASWMKSDVVVVGEDEVIKRFNSLFSVIRVKAPKAKIVVVGYPVLLGKDATPDNTRLTQQQIDYHRGKGEWLERIFVKACEGQSRVTYISVWDQSADHGVGSKDPWVNGPVSPVKALLWSGPAPWHPNEEGMKQIANIVYPLIK